MQQQQDNHLLSTSIKDETASTSTTKLVEYPPQVGKTVVQISRLEALKRSWVHAIPLSITLAILLLNLFSKYWRDLGTPHQNAILQAFQFAAKFHEIFIGMSLSAIVFHRIRYGLSVSGGVPLGLLPAGYQLSSIEYFTEAGFWSGVLAKPTLRWLPLSALIAWGFALSTVVGPSSAILLIPKLDFWDLPNSFFNTPDHKMNPTYILNTSSALWPQQLGAEDVDPSCVGEFHTTFVGCPSSGFNTVFNWIQGHVDQNLAANISISNNNMARWLTTTPSSEDTANDNGWTMTSTIGAREAEAIANYWEYIETYSPNVASLSRPVLAPALDGSAKFKKPAVQVQCSAYYDAENVNTVQFPHSELHSPPLDDFKDENWNFPVDFSSDIRDAEGLDPDFSEMWQGENITDVIFFQFVDLSNITRATVLGALAAFPTRNGSTVIMPCTIDAHWAPVSLHIDPSSNANIYQDTPDPSALVTQDNASYNGSQMVRIGIDTSWADLLDPPATTTTGGNLTNSTAVRVLIREYGSMYQKNSSSTPRYLISGSQTSNQTDDQPSADDQATIPWRISTLLGMYITEGLARVHEADATLVYHNYVKDPYVLRLNNLSDGHYNWTGAPNGSISFPEYDLLFQQYLASIYHTKVNWNTQRYGYSWGFRGTPMLLATMVLLAQALTALVHTTVTVYGGWTSDSWDTMGEMLVLALNSAPPGHWEERASAGSEVWGKIVRVREGTDTRSELVVAEDRELDGERGLKKPKTRNGWRRL